MEEQKKLKNDSKLSFFKKQKNINPVDVMSVVRQSPVRETEKSEKLLKIVFFSKNKKKPKIVFGMIQKVFNMQPILLM